MDSFKGGVFDPQAGFVEGCLCGRGSAPALRKPVEIIHEPCVWCGMLFGHFGHFIWESLSRLAAMRKSHDRAALFISPNPIIYNWQKLFFKTIGVRNPLWIVKQPIVVRQLIYVDAGISLSPLYISDEQLNAMARIDASQGAPDKIWLSRTRLKQGIVTNEAAIEDAIKDFGYEIVNPELLPIRRQISLTTSARVVAGFDGSQFFSFLFGRDTRGKFRIFNRRPRAAETLRYSLERKNIPNEIFNFDIKTLAADSRGVPVVCEALEAEKIIEILRSQ